MQQRTYGRKHAIRNHIANTNKYKTNIGRNLLWKQNFISVKFVEISL